MNNFGLHHPNSVTTLQDGALAPSIAGHRMQGPVQMDDCIIGGGTVGALAERKLSP